MSRGGAASENGKSDGLTWMAKRKMAEELRNRKGLPAGDPFLLIVSVVRDSRNTGEIKHWKVN